MKDTGVGSHNSPLEERDLNMDEGDTNKDTEVAPALIAVHPTHKSVAVAVGSELRIFELEASCAISLVDDSVSPFHKDSIRATRYGAKGKHFVSAGDDKVVKIWSTESWRCISTLYSENRVSAAAVSNDGLLICFADKFGVVWVVDLYGIDEIQPVVNKKPMPLLSHYCSIITSLIAEIIKEDLWPNPLKYFNNEEDEEDSDGDEDDDEVLRKPCRQGSGIPQLSLKANESGGQ